MYKLNEKYEFIRNISYCFYTRFSPSEVNTKNTANSQIYINIPRKDSVPSLLTSHIDIHFDVLRAASNDIYVDGNNISLLNLGPIVLFSSYKLTTKAGKQLEDISHAHIVSLIYKVKT